MLDLQYHPGCCLVANKGLLSNWDSGALKMVHLILVVTSEVLHPGCGEVDPSHLYFLVGKTTEP